MLKVNSRVKVHRCLIRTSLVELSKVNLKEDDWGRDWIIKKQDRNLQQKKHVLMPQSFYEYVFWTSVGKKKGSLWQQDTSALHYKVKYGALLQQAQDVLNLCRIWLNLPFKIQYILKICFPVSKPPSSCKSSNWTQYTVKTQKNGSEQNTTILQWPSESWCKSYWMSIEAETCSLKKEPFKPETAAACSQGVSYNTCGQV